MKGVVKRLVKLGSQTAIAETPKADLAPAQRVPLDVEGIGEAIVRRGRNPIHQKNTLKEKRVGTQNLVNGVLALRSGALEHRETHLFGWKGLNVRDRKEDIERLKNGKAVWESLDTPAHTVALTDADQHSAKSALILAYGQDFYDHIQARGPLAFNEGLDMASAIYDPVENSAFFLSNYEYEPEEGAKIHFNEQGDFMSIEIKGQWGPFKNGGEFFASKLKHSFA